DELRKMNISQFLSESSLSATMERQKKRLDDRNEPRTQRYELQMIRKNGENRITEVVTSLINRTAHEPLIQTIIRDVTEQKQAEDNFRAYAGRVIVAQEEERKRIARELHDETAQALVSLGMDINLLMGAKGTTIKNPKENLEKLRNRTDSILQGVRSLSQALRPPMLEELGLFESLQGLTKSIAAQYGVISEFHMQGILRRFNRETEIAIFRITQEALNNAGKHAEATKVEVNMDFHPGKVEVKICDDGHGFELPYIYNTGLSSGKLGLIGMQERARLINGKLTVQSNPGDGTTVILEVLQ
ncbi:PAS domain-containing sensor histidine kinase, partial [Chloroflexota bacterium]